MEILTIIRFIGTFLLGGFFTIAMVAMDMSFSKSINDLENRLMPKVKVVTWLLIIVITIILFTS